MRTMSRVVRPAAIVGARVTGPARMLPGFVIVGAKRAGTTSLYHYLVQHPKVGRCLVQKGTHYWDVNHARGWGWYRSCFPLRARGASITGEASPYLMFHPLAAERLAATLPDTRLIAVLRDPVELVWSHYNFEVRRGFETRTFEDALAQEEGRLAGEVERMLDEPGYESFTHRHHAYLARARYAEQFERLLGYFPREQLLVLRSEHLAAAPGTALQPVWGFLGLPSREPTSQRRDDVGSYGAMPPGLRSDLREYFGPHEQRLSALLGMDLSWTDAASVVASPSVT